MKTTITFKKCGLKLENNFLQAPKCECGCGGYANLILKTNDEVKDFIGTMLYEDDCNHCAIFVFQNNNQLIFGVKTKDKIKIYEADGNNREKMIAGLQKNAKFHCYGLLEQVDDDLYAIIMN